MSGGLDSLPISDQNSVADKQPYLDSIDSHKNQDRVYD